MDPVAITRMSYSILAVVPFYKISTESSLLTLVNVPLNNIIITLYEFEFVFVSL